MSTKPHDALFRATFTQLEHARATLAVLLPAAVSRHIDWASLRLLPGSFITHELKERVTDLLYSVRLRGGGELLLHLLFEHQSEVDVFMALRLLEYMVDIWTTTRREHPELPRLPPVTVEGRDHEFNGDEFGRRTRSNRIVRVFEASGAFAASLEEVAHNVDRLPYEPPTASLDAACRSVSPDALAWEPARDGLCAHRSRAIPGGPRGSTRRVTAPRASTLYDAPFVC